MLLSAVNTKSKKHPCTYVKSYTFGPSIVNTHKCLTVVEPINTVHHPPPKKYHDIVPKTYETVKKFKS